MFVNTGVTLRQRRLDELKGRAGWVWFWTSHEGQLSEDSESTACIWIWSSGQKSGLEIYKFWARDYWHRDGILGRKWHCLTVQKEKAEPRRNKHSQEKSPHWRLGTGRERREPRHWSLMPTTDLHMRPEICSQILEDLWFFMKERGKGEMPANQHHCMGHCPSVSLIPASCWMRNKSKTFSNKTKGKRLEMPRVCGEGIIKKMHWCKKEKYMSLLLYTRNISELPRETDVTLSQW